MRQVKTFILTLVTLTYLVSVYPKTSNALTCGYQFGPEYFSCNNGTCDFLFKLGFESTGNFCDTIDTIETSPGIDSNLSRQIISSSIPQATGIYLLKYKIATDSPCIHPFQAITPLTQQQVDKFLNDQNCLNHFDVEKITSTNDNQSISLVKTQIVENIEIQRQQDTHKKNQSLVFRLIPLIGFLSAPLIVVLYLKSSKKIALGLLCILPFQCLYYLSTFIYGYAKWDYWIELDIIFPKIYLIVIITEVVYISAVIATKKWIKQH